MSALRTAFRDYISMRRGLGYKFVLPEVRLAGFVTFMEQRGVSVITRDLALEWSMQPINRRATWGIRLTDVRGFAQYLCSLDPRTEVPPAGILPSPSRCKPYLYSEAEIRDLLAAAFALPPSHALRRWTYYCLFGLLAVTGMRISEALNLQDKDVDLKSGILTIRDTKFGKTRLVPVHPSTKSTLQRYAKRRDAHRYPPRCSHFFVAERGGRLLLQYVHRVFWRLSRQTGLRSPSDHTGPRLHDLRHRFAVQTLLNGYRTGQGVDVVLPVLSTYLGHTCVRDTYWYLSACPELLGHAASRLERHWEVTP
jgi:integrase